MLKPNTPIKLNSVAFIQVYYDVTKLCSVWSKSILATHSFLAPVDQHVQDISTNFLNFAVLCVFATFFYRECSKCLEFFAKCC